MNKTELRGRVDELASEPDRMRRRLVALGALRSRGAGDAGETSALERLERETR